MGAKAYDVRRLNRPLDYVVDKMRRIGSAKLNFTFQSEHPDGYGGCWFAICHSVSMTSWGENIKVSLHPIDFNTTDIEINSECALPTQIVDWGKNKKNIEAIFKYLASF